MTPYLIGAAAALAFVAVGGWLIAAWNLRDYVAGTFIVLWPVSLLLLVFADGWNRSGLFIRRRIATPAHFENREALRVVTDTPTRYRVTGNPDWSNADEVWEWRRVAPGVRVGHWIDPSRDLDNPFVLIGRWGQPRGLTIGRKGHR